jgi:hypothetical protein
MLAFSEMNAVRQLRAGGLTAFMASFLALNCGEQEFNLLPLEEENGRGGSTTGGEDGNGGFQPGETGGASTGGRSNNGGRGGSPSVPPCVAPECCTKHDDCTERLPYCLKDYKCHECYLDERDGSTIGCGEEEVCGVGYRCYLGCVTRACPDNLVCAGPNQPCVDCLTHEDCADDDERKFCVFYTCVSCRTNADCPSFQTCNQNNRCV